MGLKKRTKKQVELRNQINGYLFGIGEERSISLLPDFTRDSSLTIRTARVYLGIDPGASTGFCLWCPEQPEVLGLKKGARPSFVLWSHDFLTALDLVVCLKLHFEESLEAVVENNTGISFHARSGHNTSGQIKMTSNAGEVAAKSKLMQQRLSEIGCEPRLYSPKSVGKKGKRKESISELFTTLYPNYEGQNNEHSRDAWYLLYDGVRGLNMI